MNTKKEIITALRTAIIHIEKTKSESFNVCIIQYRPKENRYIIDIHCV